MQEQPVEQNRTPISQMIKWGGGAAVPTAVISLAAHGGVASLLVAAGVAFVAARHGQQGLDYIHDHLELPDFIDQKITEQKQQRRQGRSILDRALGRFPEDDAQEDEAEVLEAETESLTPDDENTAFVSASAQTEVPGVARITIEQIVAHTERNSYQVFIGRSMSRPNNPAVKINFYGRHLKLIGASQHGKSSMAAALIDAITRTHDESLVQIAILDLEDRTGRLFEDLPHITRIRMRDETIRLHARSYEQVLQHLEHISRLIDYRYGLPSDELERQPLLIVYLEEFVDLKDFFKQRMNAVERDEQEQARQDYARLVYYIKKIAARGLKVHIQLLMCAQVDYRDDDLQAALVNVTSGMSFCVRVSAAQAAGFYQTELLARNAREDKIGQAVVEMPDCKDLILAPEFDLTARLQALSPVHHSPEYLGFELREQRSVLVKVNGENGVNAPVKQGNAQENTSEYSLQSENVSPSFTASEETQVLLAYAELLKAGKPVTRTGIRDELDWDNKQYTRVVKPVCDKHHIG